MEIHPSDPQRIAGRRELEQLWLKKAVQAQKQYIQAAEQHRRMAEEIDRDLISYPDGAFAVAKARRAEALAQSELRRVLLILKRLMIYGIPPADDDDGLLYSVQTG